MPQINLASFNIGKGGTKVLSDDYTLNDVAQNLGRISNFINDNDFDVIGMQEVDVKTNRCKQIDEPSFIRDALNWPTRSSRFQPAMNYQGGEFGNSILVNLSKKHISYKNDKIQRKNYLKITGKENRSALAIRVDIKLPSGSSREFKNLWFVTTHFDIPFTDWMHQLCRMLVWSDGFNFPVLICGDLNVRERNESGTTKEYHLMKENFEKYGFVDVGPFKNNFTFPRMATKKIDYMFLRDDRNWFTVDRSECIKTKPGGNWLSDHWALACTLGY